MSDPQNEAHLADGADAVPTPDLSASKLRAREAFNFALFQHSPDATTIVDAQGRVVKSNLARRNSGIPLPPLGSELFADSSAPYEKSMRTLLRDCLANGQTVNIAEMQHGDCYETITIAPLEAGAIVITRDITARKRAEAEVVHAQKLAALGTMVSGMAHEVSNPNNIMILSIGALRKLVAGLWPILDRYQAVEGPFAIGRHSYADVRRDMPELVEAIARAAARIDVLVKDLKNFARKEPEDRRAVVDINKLVDTSVTMLHSVIAVATERFKASYGTDLPVMQANGPRIEQVVINLLTNALESLDGRDKAVSIATRFEPASAGVIIEVRDEGKGIPPEHLARIMDPFFTTKHDTGGTGLGLSISRKIVDMHGGSLTVSSEPGKGTVATVTLPVAGGPL